MTLGQYIRDYRERMGLSRRALAAKCGVSHTYIGLLEDGANPKTKEPVTPTIEKLYAVARGMGTTLQDLLREVDDLYLNISGPSVADTLAERRVPSCLTPIGEMQTHMVPLIGSVAAGEPILASEDYSVYIDSPAKADYALRVEGDSMEPTYLDGDVVYIRTTDDVDDGTVAVVLIDDEACLKHVYHIENGLQLVSENPRYAPMIRTVPEYDTIRVLGTVCGYTRMYR